MHAKGRAEVLADGLAIFSRRSLLNENMTSYFFTFSRVFSASGSFAAARD